MKFNVQTENFPDSFYVFIEIPQGGNTKLEYKFDVENIVLDRILFTSMVYPTNYGFVLNTKAKDEDPLDVLVISSVPMPSGAIVKCRAIGIAEMSDEEGSDNKVIAVPLDKVDPMSKEYTDIKDVPDAVKDKIKHFFQHYKELEKGKFMTFHDFKGKDEAIKQIKESLL
ncbi:inorganic diphosphatase [Ferroplasma acidarmanus]|uniref:Inorganic pyrophosphatase n=1 Tax=Ferroplasma acidarmanus Fer1 TaxID=333146 RepID=S0AN10_FERAC|nr:inorganic diphosphatase [Ferroplasma acidarmanus]AGO60137.1 inorganic pyrophosphatase [Ferroplasma acidarmanus Fer1]